MYSPIVWSILASLLTGTLAQSSACTGAQYNDLPGFPARQSACYPTNYYRTSDLGNTSPDDARSRCQQQCTADGSCGSVVAQVNKAADSNLYSGTCFFFAEGQTVTPRRCADTAYLLLGYKKDRTNDCFSRSSSAASSFCSSYLGIPVVTSVVTSTPPVVSATATATTSSTSLTTTTTTTTPVTTLTLTMTTTTTVATTTTTSLTTTSTTTTSTFTSTTTVTTQVYRKQKRATPVPTPACVTSGTPATRLSAACSCLSVPTSTSTTTTTLVPVTSTTTTTQTVVVPSTITNTATAAMTTTTASTTSTVSVTATSTSVSTITNTATSTTTQVVTKTSTMTAASSSTCSSAQTNYCQDCYCNIEEDGHTAFCADTTYCNTGCKSNQDCVNRYGAGAICGYSQECGSVSCSTNDTCPSNPPNHKRDLEDVFAEAEKRGLYKPKERRVVRVEV